MYHLVNAFMLLLLGLSAPMGGWGGGGATGKLRWLVVNRISENVLLLVSFTSFSDHIWP